ncbi:MAG TPA: HAMP domain-containing sensor histidine kinase [Polyangiaceae bacterium]|nr:HAMP domain-containing sensor histidine kinase [Polyangiaceae bacterium]
MRSLGSWAVILLSVLVIGHSLALLWTSRVAWESARDVERDSEHVNTTNELERMLREYNRLVALSLATGEEEIRPILSDLEASLRGAVAQAQSDAHERVEARRWRRLAVEVDAYFRTADSIAARNAPLQDMARTLRPPHERALSTIALLRQQNEANRRRSLEHARQALRIQSIVVVTSGVALLVAFALVAFGMHHFVLKPLWTLKSALERFRRGEADHKISGGPLAETRELAERFNEMVDVVVQQRRDQLTFLAGVAHDLRNPLSALKLTVSSLERDPCPPKPERFQRLDRQLDRLTRMVGDLLDATRIESGRLELRLQDVDIREAVRAMVDLYSPTTTTHRVVVKVPDEPVIVRADALRLEQVVSNLLSNAIKYSPKGGLVSVSVCAAGAEAVVSISDQGVGIAPEEVPRVFEPFRRGSGTAESTPGAGLGLSIARRIIDAHGGHIDVESTVDVGSTFRVRLPRRQSSKPAPC